MMLELPNLQEIETAAEQIYQVLQPTPQYCWPLLCERSGVETWVKHENHLPIGAFKVRGGLVYMNDLRTRQPRVTGVVSATRGNHGQSVAFAARRLGLDPVIVVPFANSREKNSAMRAWGAELIEHGADFDDAADFAATLAEQRGLHRMPSFHWALLRGVASYWLELFRTVTDLDIVYAPIGLGSGICAGIATRNALGLATRIVGVVASGAPTYALSWDAGSTVEHAVTTRLADGLAVRRAAPEALALIRQGVERIVQVSDTEIEQAMRAYFTDTHNVAEGAGAAPLAALLQEREQMVGKKVGLILSGGNVDHDVFAQILDTTA